MSNEQRAERFERIAASMQVFRNGERDRQPGVRFVKDFAGAWIAKHATRFEAKLKGMAAREALRQQVFGIPVRIPTVEERNAVYLAERTAIHRGNLTAHTLIGGASGSGKSFGIRNVLAQEILRGTRVICFAMKDEDRRLMSDYPGATIVQANNIPINLWQYIGDPTTYYSIVLNEIGRLRSYQPQRIQAGIGYLDRLQRGLKAGEPHFSSQDFAQLLLKESDPILRALGNDFVSLNSLLGKTATVRTGLPFFDEQQIIVIELHKIPPRLADLLCGILLSRLELAAMERGHSTELHTLCVIDEAGVLCRKESGASETFSYVPWVKRFTRRLRSYGIGFIWASQSLTDLEPSIPDNSQNVMVFRCPRPDEARAAQQFLGLPESEIETIQRLEKRECLIRSAGFSQPVRDRIPQGTEQDYPSDGDVEHHMAHFWQRTEPRLIRSPILTESSAISYRETLGESLPTAATTRPSVSASPKPKTMLAEYWEMLREIEIHPEASVAVHYQNLGWSAGRGNRVKHCLVDLGLISSERQKFTNGRPREILILNPTAKELLHENETPRS